MSLLVNELGALALDFALPVAVLGMAAGIYAGAARRSDWTRVAERTVWVVTFFVGVALLALFHAFATFDFSLEYVASHSARSMPLHYRLAALWGGQAGSLLLWLWMLCAYGASCVLLNRRQNRSLMPWVDPETIGPNRLTYYASAYFLFALPGIFLVSALFFAIATMTRSMMYTYVAVVVFLVLWTVLIAAVQNRPDLQDTAALFEPFGLGAFSNAQKRVR